VTAAHAGTNGAPRTAAEEKAFYDDMWSRYGHLEGASPAAFHRRRLVVALAARAARPGMRVLDVGCGMGELLRDLAARLPEAHIAGADLSERSIVESRKLNPTFDLFALDVAAIDLAGAAPARAGQYDLVVCSEVLEHIPDHRRAAANLAALLAPGGRLIVTVPGGKMSRFDQAIGHQRHYRPDDLRALLAGAGLVVDDVLAWGFPFHNLYRTAVRLASRMTLPGEPQAAAAPSGDRSGPGLLSRVMSAGYSVFGRVLNPLFYLNLNRGGEQLIALARPAS